MRCKLLLQVSCLITTKFFRFQPSISLTIFMPGILLIYFDFRTDFIPFPLSPSGWCIHHARILLNHYFIHASPVMYSWKHKTLLSLTWVQEIVFTPEARNNLMAILRFSIFNTEAQLLHELNGLERLRTGTKIVLYNLKRWILLGLKTICITISHTDIVWGYEG